MADDPYRLLPWDLERFTLNEWNALMTHENEKREAAKQAAAKQKAKARRG